MSSICIFGIFVADLCFFANKIPDRGETVLGNNHLVGPGGKGSNQAIAAAKLDGKVNFITKVGKDNYFLTLLYNVLRKLNCVFYFTFGNDLSYHHQL